MNVGQSAHLSGQMSGQAAQMNQVGGSGVGGSGTDGMPQHQQMQDVVDLGGAIDPQFVMLRNNMRKKIFEYIGRKQLSADWRPRLPELARRLEEILFRKFPNKNEYFNMMEAPVEPQLQVAIKTLIAHNQQNQQNQQMSRQIASSSGYSTMIPTPGITQGTSGNSRMSYVTDNTGLSSSGASMVPQNANMGTSLPDHVPPQVPASPLDYLFDSPDIHGFSFHDEADELIPPGQSSMTQQTRSPSPTQDTQDHEEEDPTLRVGRAPRAGAGHPRPGYSPSLIRKRGRRG